MKSLVLVVVGVLLGVISTASLQTLAQADAKPAYLVVSGSALQNGDMSAYTAAARPLAQDAGIEILARSESITQENILEGDWHHDGFVIVERFKSMQALKSFWHSDAYQAAIPLRHDGVRMNFIIAVEGQ